MTYRTVLCSTTKSRVLVLLLAPSSKNYGKNCSFHICHCDSSTTEYRLDSSQGDSSMSLRCQTVSSMVNASHDASAACLHATELAPLESVEPGH